jgi:hypothetical protein
MATHPQTGEVRMAGWGKMTPTLLSSGAWSEDMTDAVKRCTTVVGRTTPNTQDRKKETVWEQKKLKATL